MDHGLLTGKFKQFGIFSREHSRNIDTRGGQVALKQHVIELGIVKVALLKKSLCFTAGSGGVALFGRGLSVNSIDDSPEGPTLCAWPSAPLWTSASRRLGTRVQGLLTLLGNSVMERTGQPST